MYREKSGFVQSFEFLKNSWNVISNFSDLEKVWKTEMKSSKMVKCLEGFFFWKLQQVLSKWNFFVWSNLIQSYLYVCSESWKKLCSCISLTSLLITYKYLITVSLENETVVLEKVWEKSWILDPKVCTNPESTSPLKNSNLYLSAWYRIILMIQCQ